jgi:ADP-ribose pyrophosphatase YjhB (NUDIX family)
MRSPPHPERSRAGLVAAAHQEVGNLALRVATFFRPRLTLGVRLVALDGDGCVFLVRHSYLPGLHLPGGAVDPGETCRLAAEREAREEGGLVLAAPPELFHVYWNPAGGRQDHIVLFVARGARQPAPRPMSLEIVAAGFHPADRLPDDVTPATRRRLAEVLEAQPPADAW